MSVLASRTSKTIRQPQDQGSEAVCSFFPLSNSSLPNTVGTLSSTPPSQPPIPRPLS
ncbi:hypothetical protein BDA96_07G096700 [Sorghum bicolor]|uniref:Uncharacterized protein n=1 Tax=Sorghum bicolor TaxID=4558 RepID=A0A921UA05_SORBI|nr:hypothetical protein BDA96_07G096700 [Sorghum bicolor]